jgi:ATP-binding cassette subfamily B protein IrtA
VNTRAIVDDTHTEEAGRDPLGRLLTPVRRRLFAACALRAVGAAAAVVPYAAVAEIARVLLAGPVDDRRAWLVAWVAVGAGLVRLGTTAAASALSHRADLDLQLHLRRRIARHLARVPLGWFGERRSGEVRTALEDDVDELHHLVGHWYLDLSAAVVTPVLSVVYLLTVDRRLTLVTALPAVVGAVIVARMLATVGDQTASRDAALAHMSASAVEFVEGIGVVKAFEQGGRARNRYVAAAHEYVESFGRVVGPMIGPASAAEAVFSPLVVLLTVSVGGTAMVSRGWLEPVDVLPFVLLGPAITATFHTLSHGDDQLESARLAAGRITALLDTPVLPRPTTGARTPVDRRVVLDGVSFSYDGEHEVVRDVDLVLEPGTLTALVGPSGSGKSTLARLLSRFWDPSKGRILLGGTDLRDLDPDTLHTQVGFVLQDPQLLRTSLRDNIRLGAPDATDEEVEIAARAAGIHERIAALPRGDASVVGLDVELSGGEAQRVAIARALLADPPILVLDEATAFADPESEAAIQDALSTLAVGRTVLVIAHRLHTVTDADQIVVMECGRIVERGRHDILLAAGGRYAALWWADQRATAEVVR